jgi:tetratricopeptide (TPR) repeat protein
MQAWDHVDDEPDRALPLISAAAEIATAQGLIQEGGWVDYMRAEVHMSAGRWDEAIEAGLRAIALGEERGYHRVVVRSWFALLPIARAQGGADLIRQALPALRRAGAAEARGRLVLRADRRHRDAPALRRARARARIRPRRRGEAALLRHGPLRPELAGGNRGRGRQQALDRMRARLDAGPSTALSRATEAILRGRLLLARGRMEPAAEAAEQALAEAVDRAPWWRAKAIRVLEQAGEADATLLQEAAAIEARLGFFHGRALLTAS